MTDSVRRVIDPQGLESLVRALRRRGHVVIAPVAQDGVIALAPVESGAELPVGWVDEQEAGHYRAWRTDASTRFGFAATALPWKRFVHEERVLLIRSRRTGDGLTIETPDESHPPLAFVGIRSCDLVALQRLDVVLADDARYQARRAGLIIVAVACTTAAATCFCASTDTGPAPGPGADLVLTELPDGHMVVVARTDVGRSLLDEVGGRDVESQEEETAMALVAECAQSQTRALVPERVAAAAAEPDAPGWTEVAERCLTCGNCTMVCPTCFCTTTEEHTSLTADTAERWQRWDTCFSLDFTYLHGGPVRTDPASRYRHWYLHKLVTWHDQFGSSGCVGCGRCITWCPPGIDITEEVVS